jgi:hypothetical protein
VGAWGRVRSGVRTALMVKLAVERKGVSGGCRDSPSKESVSVRLEVRSREDKDRTGV